MSIAKFMVSLIALSTAGDPDFANQFDSRIKENEKYLDSIWTGEAEPGSHVFIPQDSAGSLCDGNRNSIVGRFRGISDVDSFAIDRDSMIFFKTSIGSHRYSETMKLPTEPIAMKALDSIAKLIPGGFYRSRNAIAGPDSWFKIDGKKEIFIEHARHSAGKHFKNHARLIFIILLLRDYAWSETREQARKEIESLEIP